MRRILKGNKICHLIEDFAPSYCAMGISSHFFGIQCREVNAGVRGFTGQGWQWPRFGVGSGSRRIRENNSGLVAWVRLVCRVSYSG
jgi:hypothetical protein